MMKKKQIEDTPLIKQFFSVKAQYPDTILLYRVGDFYETYSDDASLASKILGIIETKKSNGEKGKIAMAGFPHHSLDLYLPKLVRAGYKVAICDQLEDPKTNGKKLVKRGVTELVTPGVAFNDQLLEQKENNFLAGLYLEKNNCGLALLDVSTGEFKITEGSLDYISTIIATQKPKELVVQREYAQVLKEKFSNEQYITTLDEWAFVYDSSVEKLKRQLKVDSLKGFGVENATLGISAAGSLIVYLEQTLHNGLSNICSISRIDGKDFVWLDRFTIRNLEIFQSSSGGEGVSLVSVLDKCASPMGARLLRTWLAMPLLDLKELNKRYNIVEHFKNSSENLSEVQSLIGELGDLERIISRAATGKISPREVLQLCKGLEQIEPISEQCRNKSIKDLEEMISNLKNCSSLIQTIRQTLKEDPAISIGKGPVIKEGKSSELDQIREIATNGKDYLLQMQQREIERTGISSLRIGYNNVFGYYIEVRNTFKDKVPEQWIRKQTLVNAERYITEELKEYEAKILGAEEKIYELESKIYADLVTTIQNNIIAIQTNSKILARLDVLCNFAYLAINNNYCRPTMTEDYALDIKQGRHPVIETLIPDGGEYIPNDISLNEQQQVIILTGPNMSGKSALLRQTAIIVLMAQIGCFVPAVSAEIGYFDKIFTRVGASDNISRGESTFMVEMLETSMILHNLSDRSLVLLDEIGRGTSTYDGMSIARAIVEYIHEYGKGAKTLFATHYHELNDLEELYSGVQNYHIAIKEVENKVIFLRKLRRGGVEKSFGIHVARMAGMPKEVLLSAQRSLDALEKGGESPSPHIHKPKANKKMKEGVGFNDGSMQLSFFQLDDPVLCSIKEKLNKADINNMTPLNAFDLLRQMKEELGI